MELVGCQKATVTLSPGTESLLLVKHLSTEWLDT